MTWGDLLEVVKVLGGFGAIIGGGVAVVNYRKTVELERAKWLVALHEKFFEKDTYKKTRTIIDYKTDDYSKLLASIRDDSVNTDLEEGLVDYLNFFELISALYKKEQLSIEEINLIFGYYINAINKDVDIMKFIENSGFQNLKELIKEIGFLRKM